MAEVIGDVIPFAVGVALSPIPVIAVLLLLLAPAGVRGGASFLAARVLALAALTAVFAWAADLIDDAAGSTTPAACWPASATAPPASPRWSAST